MSDNGRTMDPPSHSLEEDHLVESFTESEVEFIQENMPLEFFCDSEELGDEIPRNSLSENGTPEGQALVDTPLTLISTTNEETVVIGQLLRERMVEIRSNEDLEKNFEKELSGMRRVEQGKQFVGFLGGWLFSAVRKRIQVFRSLETLRYRDVLKMAWENKSLTHVFSGLPGNILYEVSGVICVREQRRFMKWLENRRIFTNPNTGEDRWTWILTVTDNVFSFLSWFLLHSIYQYYTLQQLGLLSPTYLPNLAFFIPGTAPFAVSASAPPVASIFSLSGVRRLLSGFGFRYYAVSYLEGCLWTQMHPFILEKVFRMLRQLLDSDDSPFALILTNLNAERNPINESIPFENTETTYGASIVFDHNREGEENMSSNILRTAGSIYPTIGRRTPPQLTLDTSPLIPPETVRPPATEDNTRLEDDASGKRGLTESDPPFSTPETVQESSLADSLSNVAHAGLEYRTSGRRVRRGSIPDLSSMRETARVSAWLNGTRPKSEDGAIGRTARILSIYDSPFLSPLETALCRARGGLTLDDLPDVTRTKSAEAIMGRRTGNESTPDSPFLKSPSEIARVRAFMDYGLNADYGLNTDSTSSEDSMNGIIIGAESGSPEIESLPDRSPEIESLPDSPELESLPMSSHHSSASSGYETRRRNRRFALEASDELFFRPSLPRRLHLSPASSEDFRIESSTRVERAPGSSVLESPLEMASGSPASSEDGEIRRRPRLVLDSPQELMFLPPTPQAAHDISASAEDATTEGRSQHESTPETGRTLQSTPGTEISGGGVYSATPPTPPLVPQVTPASDTYTDRRPFLPNSQQILTSLSRLPIVKATAIHISTLATTALGVVFESFALRLLASNALTHMVGGDFAERTVYGIGCFGMNWCMLGKSLLAEAAVRYGLWWTTTWVGFKYFKQVM